jgi:hypothetical protein
VRNWHRMSETGRQMCRCFVATQDVHVLM